MQSSDLWVTHVNYMIHVVNHSGTEYKLYGVEVVFFKLYFVNKLPVWPYAEGNMDFKIAAIFSVIL